MLGGADNPNGELLSYIIGADSITSTLGTKGEGQRLICGNFESVQFPSSGLAVFNG